MSHGIADSMYDCAEQNSGEGMAGNDKDRIVFLDYMRVFAFMSVLIGHKFLGHLNAIAADATQHIAIRYLAEATIPLTSACGVIVFFLTSGYIITHVIQTEKPTEFLIKRFFRIYPLYAAAIVLEAVMERTINGLPFPPLSILLPRLLLVGDFFSTPYALLNVEWTLRIEVMFYLFMAALKVTGLIKKPEWLPGTFLAASIALFISGPFPAFIPWSTGYFTIYAPYLLIGSCIYLAQYAKAKPGICVLSSALMLLLSLTAVAKYQPIWKESNYAAFALIIFVGAIVLQRYLHDGPLVRLFSNLTYAVYLFHNWLWQFLVDASLFIGIRWIPISVQVLIALFVFCYLTHITVEKYGLAVGRYAIKKYRVIAGQDARPERPVM
ncbi:acyltransferase family protein [Pseudomonas sp. NFX98]|uniref:acyltransferase family protein n=1 Tax=Pseudomonas sp. NFX98 TaxID=3399122 RepID=UPI0039FC94A2